MIYTKENIIGVKFTHGTNPTVFEIDSSGNGEIVTVYWDDRRYNTNYRRIDLVNNFNNLSHIWKPITPNNQYEIY